MNRKKPGTKKPGSLSKLKVDKTGRVLNGKQVVFPIEPLIDRIVQVESIYDQNGSRGLIGLSEGGNIYWINPDTQNWELSRPSPGWVNFFNEAIQI